MNFLSAIRPILTPVLKIVITVIGLLILQTVVLALPMVHEILPSDFPIPIPDIVKMLVATAILVVAVKFAGEIDSNLAQAYPALPQAGRVARWTTLLVSVLFAYTSYRILADTLFGIAGDLTWTYDLAFLGLALIPLVNLVLLSYQNLDKFIDVAVSGARSLKSNQALPVAAEQLSCGSCGAGLDAGAKFCGNCGTLAPSEEASEPAPDLCSQCGAVLDTESKFCGECGAARSPGEGSPQP